MGESDPKPDANDSVPEESDTHTEVGTSGTAERPVNPKLKLPRYRGLRPFKKGEPTANPRGINGHTKRNCVQITGEQVWNWPLPPRQRASIASAIGAELPNNVTFGQTIWMMTYLKAIGQVEVVGKIQDILQEQVAPSLFGPTGPMAPSGVAGAILAPPSKMEFRFVTVQALKDAEGPLNVIDTGPPDDLDIEPPKNGNRSDSDS